MTADLTARARELHAARAFDPDQDIPAGIFNRVFADVDLEPCHEPGCGLYDGEHADDCPDGVCPICHRRGCVCDSAYERSAGK